MSLGPTDDCLGSPPLSVLDTPSSFVDNSSLFPPPRAPPCFFSMSSPFFLYIPLFFFLGHSNSSAKGRGTPAGVGRRGGGGVKAWEGEGRHGSCLGVAAWEGRGWGVGGVWRGVSGAWDRRWWGAWFHGRGAADGPGVCQAAIALARRGILETEFEATIAVNRKHRPALGSSNIYLRQEEGRRRRHSSAARTPTAHFTTIFLTINNYKYKNYIHIYIYILSVCCRKAMRLTLILANE